MTELQMNKSKVNVTTECDLHIQSLPATMDSRVIFRLLWMKFVISVIAGFDCTVDMDDARLSRSLIKKKFQQE